MLRQIGVPKGSFYHYFDSKEAFGLEVVDHFAGYFARKLDRWFDDESRPRWRGWRHLSRTRSAAWRAMGSGAVA